MKSKVRFLIILAIASIVIAAAIVNIPAADFSLADSPAPSSTANGSTPQVTYPIMQPTEEELLQWLEEYNNAPSAVDYSQDYTQYGPQGGAPSSLSLLA